MTDRSRHQEDLQIRRLLKEGDPAADGLNPDAGELSRWRRQVLTASEAGTRSQEGRRWLLPVSAVATAAALAGLVFLLPQSPVEMPAPGAITRQMPPRNAEPVPQPAPPTPILASGDIAQADPVLPAGDETGSGAILSPDSQPTTSVSPPPVSPPQDVALAARTVHFTAPGGTRVIWTLNPELELPTLGGSI